MPIDIISNWHTCLNVVLHFVFVSLEPGTNFPRRRGLFVFGKFLFHDELHSLRDILGEKGFGLVGEGKPFFTRGQESMSHCTPCKAVHDIQGQRAGIKLGIQFGLFHDLIILP
jgi:hypothetical protein